MYDHNKIYDDVFKTFLNVIRTKENNQKAINIFTGFKEQT